MWSNENQMNDDNPEHKENEGGNGVTTTIINAIKNGIGFSDIEAILDESGLNINTPLDDNGNTLLFVAAQNGRSDLVQPFILAGADVGIKNAKSDFFLKNASIVSLKLGPECKEHLSAEQLIDLFEALEINSSLEILEISGIKLQGAAVERFSEALKRHPSLKRVVLKEASLDGVDGRKLAEALQLNCTLKDLDISRNNIGNAGAKAFAEILQANRTLEKLGLGRNGITEISATLSEQSLIKTIEVNATLKTLDLSSNDIFFEDYVELIKTLEQKQTEGKQSLTQLGIGHHASNWPTPMTLNILGLLLKLRLEKLDFMGAIDSKRELAKVLAEALKNNQTPASVNFLAERANYGIAAEEQAPELLVDALQGNSSLIEFNPCSTPALFRGAIEGVKNNFCLEKLNIGGIKRGRLKSTAEPTLNELRETNDFKMFIELLSTNMTKLKNLQVSPYLWSSEDFKMFAEALRTNTGLKSLSFGHDILSSNDAIALSKILKVNKSLKELTCGGIDAYGPGPKYDQDLNGIEAIANALSDNQSSLTRLEFVSDRGGNAKLESLKILCKSLKSNTRITNLKIGNDFGVDAVTQQEINFFERRFIHRPRGGERSSWNEAEEKEKDKVYKELYRLLRRNKDISIIQEKIKQYEEGKPEYMSYEKSGKVFYELSMNIKAFEDKYKEDVSAIKCAEEWLQRAKKVDETVRYQSTADLFAERLDETLKRLEEKKKRLEEYLIHCSSSIISERRNDALMALVEVCDALRMKIDHIVENDSNLTQEKKKQYIDQGLSALITLYACDPNLSESAQERLNLRLDANNIPTRASALKGVFLEKYDVDNRIFQMQIEKLKKRFGGTLEENMLLAALEINDDVKPLDYIEEHVELVIEEEIRENEEKKENAEAEETAVRRDDITITEAPVPSLTFTRDNVFLNPYQNRKSQTNAQSSAVSMVTSSDPSASISPGACGGDSGSQKKDDKNNKRKS